MTTIRQNTGWGLRTASRFLLLCMTWHAAAQGLQPGKAGIGSVKDAQPADLTPGGALRTEVHGGGGTRARDLRFEHLTTKDGLSQTTITEIVQDRLGFMWFATRDGLNRYDGNTFVVYKHSPSDPGSLSANFVEDLTVDDQGCLWIATLSGGVDKFDPTTERFARFRHDPGNPNSISGDAVESVTRDSRGFLWFGTGDTGLDRLDPRTGAFTHYLNDNNGEFVGRITHVIEDRRHDIWFVGGRGLFHLDPQTGVIRRPRATIDGLGADYICEDSAGDLWILAYLPAAELVKYDRRAERFTEFPFGATAVGVPSSAILPDGENGLWVSSSQGLYYFDRRSERFTQRFQHDEADPDSLNDNTVVSIYRDRGGLLWVGTEGGGINILDFRQEHFGYYHHRRDDPNTPSPGKVTSIYEDSQGVLWIGYQPRALDRLDRKTGKITHYVADPAKESALGKGSDVKGIYKDARGYLWLGGWGSGLDRLDERTGEFRHYRPKPGDPNSLISDHVFTVYGDKSGHIWVGQRYGLSRLEPATGHFTNFRPDPKNRTNYGSSISSIYQDGSGAMWLGTTDGLLVHADENANNLGLFASGSRDSHRLQSGSIAAIHEDRTGTLWLGAWDGLYKYNTQNGTFVRYTESDGLPSSVVLGILEDRSGRLWLSTKKGISRFDPGTATFKNYDVLDGLQGDDFDVAFEDPGSGEMFFGGSNGFNAFFPENIRDDSFVPPVVITSLKIFNKPVPIGARSVLKKAVPYVDSLTLSYRDNVFSFEFAALSYANSQKNRYRYKLENFDPGWSEVGSNQRLATYTNLDPGKYVFRVQGSNSDGVWNEQGASLAILVTPPWWNTTWVRALCALLVLGLLWAWYQWRLRQLGHHFEITLEARVGERTRIAREIHDTLLQSFQGLLLQLEAVSQMHLDRPTEAKQKLDRTIERGARAITEGRDAVQGLRASTVQTNDLARAVNALGEELAADPGNRGSPAFRVDVEGEPRNLHPILRDEIYRIAAEGLRNAFRHAQARQIEVEIRYDDQQFRLRVRDDGKGMDQSVILDQGRKGHYGLPGMRERAKLIGGKLEIWSEIGAGTEVELRIAAAAAYATTAKRSWLSELLARK